MLYFTVPGMGNTSPKDMDNLLPLMNMVIYSVDKVKKLRLNREVSAHAQCEQQHVDLVTEGSLVASYGCSGEAESRPKPCSRGGELPEANSLSATGGRSDAPRREEESGEGEDHERGGS